jgi:hypothetical protein
MVVLSTLDMYGEGYHPQMPLTGDVPIGDVLGGGNTILAWNGRSIGDPFDVYTYILLYIHTYTHFHISIYIHIYIHIYTYI